MKHNGFTLAELLIALALLGIIAAFTIPKVLQAQTEQETNAKLRETVSTLENAWYTARDTGQIGSNTLFYTLLPQLNVVNSFNGPADLVMPFPGPLVNLPSHPCKANNSTDGWVEFANGVLVMGLDYSNLDLLPYNDPSHTFFNNHTICIDVNGAASPNMPGQDVFYGNFNQYAAFQVVAASEQASLKSFRWGCAGPDHATCDIYAVGANFVYNAGAFGLLGDSTTVPCASVGCRLVR